MDRAVVKELIQEDLNEKELKLALDKVLNLSNQYLMREDFRKLKVSLGNSGASERSAEIISKFTAAITEPGKFLGVVAISSSPICGNSFKFLTKMIQIIVYVRSR